MPAPLDLTFQTLIASRNEAATDLLIEALDAESPAIVASALGALMLRRSRAGHLAVLRRWHTLTAQQLEQLRAGRGKIGPALRDALVSDDVQLAKNAFEFTVAFNEYDSLPTLITIAEGPDSRRSEPALALINQLIGQLSRLMSGGRDPYERRDPHQIARNVLESLERSLERFRRHRRNGLVEAFVTLAGPTCPALLKILDSPHQPCYGAVIEALHHSESAGVVNLIVRMLEAGDAPAVILGVIARREDAPFKAALLAASFDNPSSTVRKNLSRVASLACLEPPQRIVDLPAAFQAAAIRLLMLSGINLGDKLLALECVLDAGASEGRLAACEAIASISGDHANRLILKATENTDPVVQALAAERLRDRHVPGMMSRLLELADHPDPVVAAAARGGLVDLNFERYLQRFDALDDDERLSAGLTALKVDQAVVPALRAELESTTRRSRLRAIEVAELLSLEPQVADALVERLEDPDHLVRTAAAEALGRCSGMHVRDALIAALADRSPAVQQAASASLDALRASLAESASSRANAPLESPR